MGLLAKERNMCPPNWRGQIQVDIEHSYIEEENEKRASELRQHIGIANMPFRK